MSVELAALYSDRYDRILVPAARSLEALLQDYLKDIPRCDRIYARAKTSNSFLAKAAKVENGTSKYPEPLSEIQDQIAARVIVFFQDDVKAAQNQILKYFTPAEHTIKEPESDWAFGYFGLHLVLALPGDVVPERVNLKEAPRLFELQIRTLFQHAWSEANHDLGYKPESSLSSDQTRRLAFTAAQSWGADHIFNELLGEKRIASGAQSGGQ